MAVTIQFPPLLLLVLFSSYFIFQISSQFTPQNIQVFYPFPLPPPPHSPHPPPPSPPPSPPPPPPLPLPPSTDTTPLTPTAIFTSPPSSSSNKTVAKAVAATAAGTLVISGLLFLLLVKYKRYRKEKEKEGPDLPGENNNRNTVDPVVMMNNQFTRIEGIKGVIVDEEGLDVLYWKNLDDDNDINHNENKKTIFIKEPLRINEKEEEKRMTGVDYGKRTSKKFDVPIQEVPLLRGKSSGSHIWPAGEEESQNDYHTVGKQEILIRSQTSSRSPPPTPPSPPPPPPPPPPLVVEKKSHVPPPPPLLVPKKGSLTSSSKPPPPPPQPAQVKFKPLHWDKVNANVGHPTAWDQVNNGSFRFDGDLMEALFGTVAANKKSPRSNNSPSPKAELKSGPPSQRFILDTHRSQNIAIILRSLNVSRQEIIDCLLEGKGLDIDNLEKLTKISPTKEEEELILNYDQDITRLADAESFLYHILRAVPSAFTRFNAMFFKLNYTSEVSQIKNTLQMLEAACQELKARGLFVKLLEAILKSGNRMNAGTSRGNAQAFNLNSLLKLSDVKSSDGKTTLLHFVVEEVVRLEGKRCMINRNHSLRNSTASLKSDSSRGKDYIMLGLPIVGGVSSEYSNVKKAAGIDYDTLLKSCDKLSNHLDEINKIVEECVSDNGGRGFLREMERFVERAEREIQVLRNEQERAIEIVKKTNEYYHVGASKDKGKKLFQIFVIVKAFLEMVDKACVDIAIKLQKSRNGGREEVVVPMPKSPTRPSVKFPVLPPNFISSSSSDSDSDEDL